MNDITTLIGRIEALEAEVQSLRDKDDITRVQYIYGYYLDNRMWDEMIALFSDDEPWFEIGRRGRYVGKQAIRRFLVEAMGRGRWGLEKNQIANHLQLQPVITLGKDGKSAKCRARSLIQMSTLPELDRLRWAEGVYENEFVKDAAGWKLKSIWWAPTFYALIPAIGKVWFESIPEDEVIKSTAELQSPDAALGRIWVPFHYKHPYSGEEVPPPSARR